MVFSADVSLHQIVSALLDELDFKAVFGLRKRGAGKAFYSLFTDSSQLKDFDPFFPVMPQNAAKAISHFTFHEFSPYKVAVVLRPCEMRALIELVKLEQAKLDNILFVGLECGGVFPFEIIYSKGEADKLYSDYMDALKRGSNFDGIRDVCKGCDLFWPENVDIVVSCIGREKPSIIFCTEKGVDIARSLNLNISEADERTEASLKLEQERLNYKEKMISDIKERLAGVDGLLAVFGRCIGCHNCSHVCPLCYCKDCFFESSTFDYEAESYVRRVQKRGTIRVPMDTLLFHLGRMTHMATSCVSCGMCSDVCPVGIPVSVVFKAVGSDLQALFDYVPGRDLGEPLPLTTFRYDELHEVEDM